MFTAWWCKLPCKSRKCNEKCFSEFYFSIRKQLPLNQRNSVVCSITIAASRYYEKVDGVSGAITRLCHVLSANHHCLLYKHRRYCERNPMSHSYGHVHMLCFFKWIYFLCMRVGIIRMSSIRHTAHVVEIWNGILDFNDWLGGRLNIKKCRLVRIGIITIKIRDYRCRFICLVEILWLERWCLYRSATLCPIFVIVLHLFNIFMQ